MINTRPQAHSKSDSSTFEILQYSFLALPLAFASLPLYIHAPDFYTRDLGMNSGLIGIILLAIRLLDAFQDPLIGYISDNNTSKRLMIVMSGVAMLVIGMVGVFIGPPNSVPVPVWFAGTMMVATTGFSIVSINLNMIGGFLQNDKNKRTTISAWREGFGLVGLLVASILPAALQESKSIEESFEVLILVFIGLIIIAALMFRRFMEGLPPKHAVYQSYAQNQFSFLPILFGKDKLFFMTCFISHVAAAIPGVMVLFFIRDYLSLESLTGLFLFLYFISGAAFMPLWVKLAKHLSKEKSWLFSMVLSVVTFIGAFFLSVGDAVGYGVICVLSGIALGADLALPPSIVADRISGQKRDSEATQFYALLSFIPKVALAIASGASFLALGYFGFVAGQENSEQTLSAVITIYALVPCIIKSGAAVMLWFVIKQQGENNEINERIDPHGTTSIY